MLYGISITISLVLTLKSDISMILTVQSQHFMFLLCMVRWTWDSNRKAHLVGSRYRSPSRLCPSRTTSSSTVYGLPFAICTQLHNTLLSLAAEKSPSSSFVRT